jgi:hypothetical protein
MVLSDLSRIYTHRDFPLYEAADTLSLCATTFERIHQPAHVEFQLKCEFVFSDADEMERVVRWPSPTKERTPVTF